MSESLITSIACLLRKIMGEEETSEVNGDPGQWFRLPRLKNWIRSWRVAVDRRGVRLLSRVESIATRPDRGAALRVNRPRDPLAILARGFGDLF